MRFCSTSASDLHDLVIVGAGIEGSAMACSIGTFTILALCAVEIWIMASGFNIVVSYTKKEAFLLG